MYIKSLFNKFYIMSKHFFNACWNAIKEIFGQHAFVYAFKYNEIDLDAEIKTTLDRSKKVSDFVGFIIRSIFCIVVIKYLIYKYQTATSHIVMTSVVISLLFVGALLAYLLGAIYNLMFMAIVKVMHRLMIPKLLIFIITIIAVGSIYINIFDMAVELAKLSRN